MTTIDITPPPSQAETIPVIDFGPARMFERADPAGLRSVAAQIADAARTVGFFYLVGHGIPTALTERTFAFAQQFFALPQSAKDAVHISRSTCRRGYENLGDQTLDLGAHPDRKESYYCGIHYDPAHPFVAAGYDSYGPNLWPSDLPGFEQTMLEYIGQHTALCERLMQVIAISLDLDAHHFDDTFHDPLTTLRLLRYPPHPADADDLTFGAGAHTDWGSITTLAQDDIGGLQVLGPDGRWLSAPPIAGSLVVNLGDLMPRWTNGRFRSNSHRVINLNSAGRDRYSIPFFYAPRYDASVQPLPTCATTEEIARHVPFTVGEHIAEMVRLTYNT